MVRRDQMLLLLRDQTIARSKAGDIETSLPAQVAKMLAVRAYRHCSTFLIDSCYRARPVMPPLSPAQQERASWTFEMVFSAEATGGAARR